MCECREREKKKEGGGGGGGVWGNVPQRTFSVCLSLVHLSAKESEHDVTLRPCEGYIAPLIRILYFSNSASKYVSFPCGIQNDNFYARSQNWEK